MMALGAIPDNALDALIDDCDPILTVLPFGPVAA